ncbi:GNAT family N-acetyltransferase [Saccharospirillum mangrovi]|uniref:GNAT family N-acetyltransferase n=1 Tax=Saccharospirillum mangrovi TaxID=2161747 RepID=UPI000D3D484E|nr:GNAT family N-acetyltransferase [Saccharospirillum mangrovi]
MELRTERCRITPYTEADMPGHQAIYQSAEVRRFLSWPVPPALSELRELYIERAKRWQAHTPGSGAFSVRLHDQEDYVGLLLLKAMPYGDGRFSDRIEIGWHLANPFWGQGLATEAAQALLTYGFEVLGLDTIWAVADPNNAASTAVMQRLGMHYVETTDRYYGEEGVLYSISKAAA